MNLIEKSYFIFENSEYEIRVFNMGWEIIVKVFHDKKPSNGFTYSVSLPTAFDLAGVTETDIVKIFKERAKSDIENKIWQKYVDEYINGLDMVSKEKIGCRKCGKRNITISIVDNRNMYECKDCGNIWYDEFVSGGAYELIIDEIISNVAENNTYETYTTILLNTLFRNDSEVGLSFNDKLRNWTNLNKLKFEIFNNNEGQKIRFWR